ncbi:hypothetical protein AVEN_261430-1 [Araneus ventricosus]|uniref:Uncharacterized protein n=1 Tax=Araneus ventricosus TaxID=182803 RepID=A0A4Y2GVZ0_ARAVE|nr:hypothetical protein AVEN_261430-1 [Araneus ventricosus]
MPRHCGTCVKCPSKDNLVQFLQSKFEDYDEEDIIEYSQWVSTDRTKMIQCSSSVSEFIDQLVEKLNKLIPHSTLPNHTLHFFFFFKGNGFLKYSCYLNGISENYAFTIKDEAQGYHWTSDSCTIHPVVVQQEYKL